MLEAIAEADAVIFAPSNPYLSIDPILAIPGVRETLAARTGPVAAVSPIIGGRAIKGPADRMLLTLACEASARAVAAHYADVLSHILVDTADASLASEIEALGVRTRAAETIMRDAEGRAAVAQEALRLVDMLAP